MTRKHKNKTLAERKRKFLEENPEYQDVYFCYNELTKLNDELNILEKQIDRFKNNELTEESMYIIRQKITKINSELNSILERSDFPKSTKRLIGDIISRNESIGMDIFWPTEGSINRL